MTHLAQLYLSGEVRRWHANPALARSGQTNADHQGRCVQLLLMLHPAPSPALVRAIAFHDVGEAVVGDLPAPFKAEFPEIAALHAGAERIAREGLCLPDDYLTGVEGDWMKLIDLLESCAFALLHAPACALSQAHRWPEARRDVQSRAERLGCGAVVAEFFARLIMAVT